MRVSAGGEVLARSVALVPFLADLPGTNPYLVVNWLDTCLGGPEPATEVLFENAVTVDTVRGILATGPGLLLWAGHGTIVPADTTSQTKVCALLTGESYTEAESLAGVIVNKYRSSVGPSSDYLRVIRMNNRYYTAIMPGFVRQHGNFDYLE